MGHVVLLGDSIFDNDTYVEPEPTVIGQLRHELGPDWQTTLLAVDGSVTKDVIKQLKGLPDHTTHLMISTGGNNALREATLLIQEPPNNAFDVLQRFTEIKALFQHHYHQMVQAVVSKGCAKILREHDFGQQQTVVYSQC